MDLPTGILSKHITRKGDLCIRNLHQTFLRSEVTFGERSGCLISAICHLGTILCGSNDTCSVCTILLITHQVPIVNTLESQFNSTFFTDVFNTVSQCFTGIYTLVNLIQSIGIAIEFGMHQQYT